MHKWHCTTYSKQSGVGHSSSHYVCHHFGDSMAGFRNQNEERLILAHHLSAPERVGQPDTCMDGVDMYGTGSWNSAHTQNTSTNFADVPLASPNVSVKKLVDPRSGTA